MGKTSVKEAPARSRKPETQEAPVQIDGCRHHWVIETPRGALSSGRCKVCGEEREFRNSANDYIWDDDSSSGSSWGSRSRPSRPADDDGEMVAAGSGGSAAIAV
jgi:hypothetical protein